MLYMRYGVHSDEPSACSANAVFWSPATVVAASPLLKPIEKLRSLTALSMRRLTARWHQNVI